MENIVVTIKPIRKKKITLPTAQMDYDAWWSIAFDKYISVSSELIFFYNTETAEQEYNAEKTAIQAELFSKYQTEVLKGQFESKDKENKNNSCQAWIPDWENVKWTSLYPPKVTKPPTVTKPKKIKPPSTEEIILDVIDLDSFVY